MPGDAAQSYTLTPSRSIGKSSIRYMLVSPTDVEDAELTIESVRLVFRRDYLAGIPSGVSWQGFGEIYRETIVSRAPERISFDVALPERPRLELALATIEDGPVTFSVEAKLQGVAEAKTLLVRTLTTSRRWEEIAVPLDELSGETVTLSLSTQAEADGALGFWGAPALRATSPDARGVILFVADTLRRDRLSTYGHDRETSPVLSRLAREGALFLDNQSQATWTKVSMPSLLTSLYPATHGVFDFPDRVPAAATTVAEAFREAGYATLALSANGFVGRATNLHQGFEVFHEDTSVPAAEKAARAYLDRLLPWIEAHRDVPFFVLIHVTDPPYPAYAPYDTLWAKPEDRDQREALVEKVRPQIQWAMDVEIGRLIETLQNADLESRTLLAFTSHHGEEFLEHGNHWHGLSAYGESSNVPLVLWGPGVPAGMIVSETVENLDVMPTLLELSGVEIPTSRTSRTKTPRSSNVSARGSRTGASGPSPPGSPRMTKPRPA